MTDWLRSLLFRLVWRDPILRIRCAWHVLQGRPLAYRLESEPTLTSSADNTWIIRVNVRRPRSPWPIPGEQGIVVGGRNIRIVGCVIDLTP